VIQEQDNIKSSPEPSPIEGGLIGVSSKIPVADNFALSVIYTPGVAEPCRQIAQDIEAAYRCTWRWNAVAVIGSTASHLPRLEYIAANLKSLAGVDAVPLVVHVGQGGSLAETVRSLAPTFGAVWLCEVDTEEAQEVLRALSDLDIPVLGPPPSGQGLGSPTVYPGLVRAILDLRLAKLDERVLSAALDAGAGASLSFAVAPKVARAAAEKAVELGGAETAATPAMIEARLRNYLESGRLPPFEQAPDWLNAESSKEQALRLHSHLGGALEMAPKLRPRDPARIIQLGSDAEAAVRRIEEHTEQADVLTGRGNMVAVVTDGSAVLGLGDIGAAAGLPVMLGKCVLFKTFGGCDAVPICVDADSSEAIIEVVEAIAPSFGGINLEDISSPRCFEIEEELQKRLDILVFHDDQHGTAVVTLAALINAARLCGKTLDELTVTFNGAGAAGIAVTKLLMAAGVKDVILCDSKGAIYEGRSHNMNPEKDEIAAITNRDRVEGTLAEAVRGRDVFIGLSVGGALTGEMVRSMADSPIVLAMANPVPEIMPEVAYAAGAAAVATGRSDFPNQVNNCLGFPGIFRGGMDVQASVINDAMKIAAAEAIAGLVGENRLKPDYFIPSAMDLRVPPAVARAIAHSAMDTGAARVEVDPEAVRRRTQHFLYEGRLD
jgi:malate dehydrogenase (oxaloacetate-decarboxylating)